MHSLHSASSRRRPRALGWLLHVARSGVTVAAMESRVTVTARKLHDLDVFDGDVTEVSAVDSWPQRTNLEVLSGSTGHANEAS
ncbi:hypothetical protein ACFTWF_40435 [Rhodococcus sp. NPDC056960]|uniref:hypothetical protein n=1 Tax=Rhodococcus sp. NPDC056960 TaxID=3345982 RepID=UPI00363F87D0